MPLGWYIRHLYKPQSLPPTNWNWEYASAHRPHGDLVVSSRAVAKVTDVHNVHVHCHWICRISKHCMLTVHTHVCLPTCYVGWGGGIETKPQIGLISLCVHETRS